MASSGAALTASPRSGNGQAGRHQLKCVSANQNYPAFMPGGLNNPLGARALYIGSTLYRLHGTTQPWSIGRKVSSGCIRLTNDDIIDLYQRASIGAKVIVI